MTDVIQMPTVGRIVHYYNELPEETLPVGDSDPKAAPRAAIVVFVWRDDLVNLQVFDPGIGDPLDCYARVATSVRYGESGPGPRWCWAPRV